MNGRIDPPPKPIVRLASATIKCNQGFAVQGRNAQEVPIYCRGSGNFSFLRTGPIQPPTDCVICEQTIK